MDALRAQLQRQRVGQGAGAELGGRPGAAARHGPAGRAARDLDQGAGAAALERGAAAAQDGPGGREEAGHPGVEALGRRGRERTAAEAVVARDGGGGVDDQVEPAQVGLGAAERLGHQGVVARVAAHADDLRMGGAQGVEGLLRPCDGQHAPSRRHAVGRDRAADVAGAEDDEDRWAAHAGSLAAVGGGGAGVDSRR